MHIDYKILKGFSVQRSTSRATVIFDDEIYEIQSSEIRNFFDAQTNIVEYLNKIRTLDQLINKTDFPEVKEFIEKEKERYIDYLVECREELKEILNNRM